ncbi:MAG: sigma-70 family RNA polymerase sigma factor [Aureliella sp.]
MGATMEASGRVEESGRGSSKRQQARGKDAAARGAARAVGGREATSVTRRGRAGGSARKSAGKSTGDPTGDPAGDPAGDSAGRDDGNGRRAARGLRLKRQSPAPPSHSKRVTRDPDPAPPRFVLAAAPQLAQTFDDAVLERDFIAFCQLSSHASGAALDRSVMDLSATEWSSTESWATRAENQWLDLFTQARDHIALPEFERVDAAREICGSTLLEPLQNDIEVDRWADSRSIYATLCATRLLTAEEERSVMRRMHYLKHLAWRLLTQPTLSRWDLTRADGLIQAAKWHRDLVVQANMRLIVSIVKKMRIESHWYDELISDGTVALLRAVNKFDPGRGYRFCTFASTVIRRDCYHYIKNRKLDDNRYRKVATVPVLPAMRGKAVGDAELPVGADRAHWLAWRERLSSMMSLLTRREQVIIRSRYCLGSHRRVKTLKRLSAALKISKERVRQIELGALEKLRAAAELEM